MPAPNWSYNEIEDAVLAALEDLKLENGGIALTVKAYQGELSAEPALQTALGRFPAVLVTILGANYDEPESLARRIQGQTWRIVVFLGSRSWRKTDASAGVYDLLQEVRSRLAGKTLGLTGVFPCYPKTESLQTNPDPSVVVYQAEFWLTNPKFTWG
jgi:phage gp37-like protein